MTYHIHQLKENLILVTWLDSPRTGGDEDKSFAQEIFQLLEDAQKPFYIISDLRRGYIRNSKSLRALAKVVNHPNFAGGTAFSSDPLVDIGYSIYLLSTYRYRFIRGREAPRLYLSPTQSLAFLEGKEHGITADIDWKHLLNAAGQSLPVRI